MVKWLNNSLGKFVYFSFFIFILSFILYPSSFIAQATTMDFLKIDPSPRGSALGAYSALVDDFWALRCNPAALGLLLHPEIQTMYSQELAGIQYGFLGYAHPSDYGTFSGAFGYLFSSRMDRIEQGIKRDKFRVEDYLLNFSYAHRIGKKFSLGMNLGGILDRIGNNQVGGFTSDLGFLYRPGWFSVALVGQNLGPKVGADFLPINLKCGLGARLNLPGEKVKFNLSVDFNQPLVPPRRDTKPNICVGLEHWSFDVLALRIGYKYGFAETALAPLSCWRAGVGLKIKGLLLDYAYIPYGELGFTQKISLGYRFGKKKLPFPFVDIKLDNPIISPNADGVLDAARFRISVFNLEEIVSWRVQIINEKGFVVRNYSGTRLAPQIKWYGVDDRGKIVENGKYKYTFEAVDEKGRSVKSLPAIISVDTTPPFVNMSMALAEISPDGDGDADEAKFSLQVSDPRGIKNWKLEIIDRNEKVVKLYEGEGEPPAELTWDGKDQYYWNVVPNGRYEVEFVVCNNLGNRSSYSGFLKVDVPVPVVTKEIQVTEMERGLRITLASSVLFDVDRAAVLPGAEKVLKEVVGILKTYPENKVAIEGHTDNTGSAGYNQRLSRKRAMAVFLWLVKQGVDPHRMKAVGYGEERPLVSNDTEEGRQLNRRVEIIILRKE